MKPPLASVKQFPPITKQRALAIAARVVAVPHSGRFECYSQLPDNCRIYCNSKEQPCWYVFPPKANDQFTLCSSRVIVISRLTGDILYDGSAGDDG